MLRKKMGLLWESHFFCIDNIRNRQVCKRKRIPRLLFFFLSFVGSLTFPDSFFRFHLPQFLNHRFHFARSFACREIVRRRRICLFQLPLIFFFSVFLFLLKFFRKFFEIFTQDANNTCIAGQKIPAITRNRREALRTNGLPIANAGKRRARNPADKR